MFPLGHRYSWAIDPQLAAHCGVLILSMVPLFGHTSRAWSMFHRLPIPTVKRCHLPVVIFLPFADISILRVLIDRTIVQCQSIAYRGAPFPGSWWFCNFRSARTAFGWFVFLFQFFSAPTSLCRSLFLIQSTMAPAVLNSVLPSFTAGRFCPWWVALLVEPAFTSLSFQGLPLFFFLLTVGAMRVSVFCDQSDTVWI